MNRSSISNILLNSIDCVYILLDRDLTIIAGNRDGKKTFHLSFFENGNEFLASFNYQYQKKFTAAFEALEHGQETVYVVNTSVNSDKNILNIKWSICSVYNDDHTLTGYELLGTISKINASESIVKEPGRLQLNSKSLFNSQSNPFCCLNLCGDIISANDAFAALLDTENAEIINTPFASLIDPENLETAKDYIAKVSKGSSVDYECLLVNKSGERLSVNIINTPFIEDSTLAGVNVFVSKKSEILPVEKIVNKDEKRLKLVLSTIKKILNSSLDMICTFDENGRFTNVSAASKDILGYKPRELIGKTYRDLVYEEDFKRSVKETNSIKRGIGTTNFENRFYRKDGTLADLHWSSRWEEADKRFYSIARDATEKKQSESALKASEEKYRVLFYDHPIPSWMIDSEKLVFLEVNEAAIAHYGYTREEFLKMHVKSILADHELARFDNAILKEGTPVKYNGLWMHKKKNSELFYSEINSNTIDYQGKKAMLILSIDRTEQTIAAQELRKSNERYYFLSEAAIDGIWDYNIETKELQLNAGARKMFEITDHSFSPSLGWWERNMDGNDRERVIKKLRSFLKQGTSRWEDEYRFKVADNNYKYIYNKGYIIYNENKKPVRLIVAMQDLTERNNHENTLQKLNQSLEKRASELAESNAELERFAYVASHDLQEPLRMVTSFLQLLEKRYKDKLDNKAHEYINYAVDGAERMKRLILDLLEYSRVNSSKAEAEDVDVEEVVADLKNLFKNVLQQTEGSIISKKLPVIKGSRTQILQLFQNIISNAIKYRSDAPPVISISCVEEILSYKFGITDNGIGIEPKFYNKIFIIFQRLHNRDEYSGTGIGLAICKKIIDKHGGNIWVTSSPGRGSTFYFTLPKHKQ